MPWNSEWPLGSASVKANRVTGDENTKYIQTTMGNMVVGTNAVDTTDHFWDVDPELDGHHRFIRSPGFTVGGNPADPLVGTAMDQVIYAKLKDASESTAQQDVQPFARNATGIAQLLGIRAMAVFDSTPTLQYGHNCVVTKNGTGDFTLTFSSALPSANYLVYIGGVRNNSTGNNSVYGFVKAGTTTPPASKTANLVRVQFLTQVSVFSVSLPIAVDPLQSWVVVFGG